MRKLSPLLLAVVLCAGCVDKDYDLTSIDTDQVTIGDEQSEFRVPLATIHVSKQEIFSQGIDIESVFREIDIWLPIQLPDGLADIQRLNSDEAYLKQLTDQLLTEIETDDAKLQEITDLIWENPDYRSEAIAQVPELALADASTFHTIVRSLLRGNDASREVFREFIRKQAEEKLTTLQIDQIVYDIDRIDLDDQVVDMLVDNLDPKDTPDAKNTLHLYGEVDNRLPLGAALQSRFTPTDIRVPVTLQAMSNGNPIDETQIGGDEMRTLIDGFRVTLDITLETYLRDRFDPTADNQLLITMHLVKRGGLKFDF